MNTEKDIAQLMDYLFGEMDSQEQIHFEEKLAADPALQKELEKLRETSRFLKQDAPVTSTEPLVLGDFVSPTVSKDQYWRKWAGVAASLLVVLMAAAWWNLHLEIGNGELRISFNKKQQELIEHSKSTFQQSIDAQKDEIDMMLYAHMQALQDSLSLQYANMKQDLNDVIIAGKPDQKQVKEYFTRAELEVFVSTLNKEHLKNTAVLLNTSTENQRAYTEKLITDLAEYMEAKRQSDLELVNYALKEMRVETKNKQDRTDLVLAKILEQWEVKQ